MHLLLLHHCILFASLVVVILASVPAASTDRYTVQVLPPKIATEKQEHFVPAPDPHRPGNNPNTNTLARISIGRGFPSWPFRLACYRNQRSGPQAGGQEGDAYQISQSRGFILAAKDESRRKVRRLRGSETRGIFGDSRIRLAETEH